MAKRTPMCLRMMPNASAIRRTSLSVMLVENMVRAMTSRVTVIISCTISTGRPARAAACHASPFLRTTPAMMGTSPATRAWLNAGEIRRRWCSQLSPSFITSPRPKRNEARLKARPFQ